MSTIPHLSNISNISRLGSVRRPNKKAYLFDWVNDYIAWDTTIGRTGYDMNVAGNVTTGSDADGSYFYFDGNRNATAATGTMANIWPSATPAFTQATDFTFSCKFNVAALPVSNYSGIFWSVDDFAMCLYNTNHIRIVSKPTYSALTVAYTLWTTVTIHVVYQASSGKAFVYKDWVLQNVWGTAMSPTFTTNAWNIWDNWSETGTNTSTQKKIYHAAIRNVALTQAEIDADIALWNTTKTDSRIVAYYIPENLQYNTQYMTNPKALDQSNRVKTWATAVTANTTTAPDWTVTADQVAISWTATQGVSWPSTAITWFTLASKTLIVKAFVKVAAWTAAFRLWIWHTGVADYYSSNQTATTTWQEFTFTQALTSSTAGTWFSGGVFNDSTATNPTLEVRNVRVFVTNETLRDESPNIGWYIGRKTHTLLCSSVKLTTDSVSAADAWCVLVAPWTYIHIRNTGNAPIVRFDNVVAWHQAISSDLWNGYRWRVHIIGEKYRDGTNWILKIYINWVLTNTWTVTTTARPPTTIYQTTSAMWLKWSTYYWMYARDSKIYTLTSSTAISAADALAICNWGNPSSWTLYRRFRPTPWEAWTTAIDHSGNSRTWTLTGGVTRPFLSWS